MNKSTFLLIAASLTFGMLIHPSFAWCVVVPTTVFAVHVCLFADSPGHSGRAGLSPHWLWSKLRAPVVARGLVPAALCAAIPVGSWYFTKGRRLFEVFQSFEETPALAVRGFAEVDPGFGWYALTAPGALSNVFALLMGAGVVSALVRRDLPTRVLLVAFVAAYLMLNQQAARAWWYFAGVLPVAAVLTAVFVRDLRSRRLSGALAVTCVAVATFNFATVTWGTAAWSRPVALALGAPHNPRDCNPLNTLFCSNPSIQLDWRELDILDTVLSDPACRRRICNLLVLEPAAYPTILLREAQARDRPDATLGIRAFNMLDGQFGASAPHNNDYLLHFDAPPGPDMSARNIKWREQTQKLISQEWYREVGRFALFNAAEVVLVKRIRMFVKPPRPNRSAD